MYLCGIRKSSTQILCSLDNGKHDESRMTFPTISLLLHFMPPSSPTRDAR